MEKENKPTSSPKRYALIANEVARKAVFRLTKRQILLFLYIVSLIKKDDPPDKWYRFMYQDMCIYLGLDISSYKTSGKYYKLLKRDLDGLTANNWMNANGGGQANASWLANADHANEVKLDENGKPIIQRGLIKVDEEPDDEEEKEHPDEKEKDGKRPKWTGVAHVQLGAYVAPYFFQLAGNYTIIDVQQVSVFNSPKTIRLYILLKSYVYKEKLEKGEACFYNQDITELMRIMNCDTKRHITIKDKEDPTNEKKAIKFNNIPNETKYFIRDGIRTSVDEINKKAADIHVEIAFERDMYTKYYKKIKFIITKAGYLQQESAKNFLRGD